jgi:hypothetical protein
LFSSGRLPKGSSGESFPKDIFPKSTPYYIYIYIYIYILVVNIYLFQHAYIQCILSQLNTTSMIRFLTLPGGIRTRNLTNLK